MSKNWTIEDLKKKGLIENNGSYKTFDLIVSENKKIKGATKVEAYGVKFDSKLEQYMYASLYNHSIEFEFQKTYQLQEGFTYLGKKVQAITLTVDFYLPQYNMLIDTKGHQTQQGALRWKMLKNILKDNPVIIEMPKNKDECNVLINRIKFDK